MTTKAGRTVTRMLEDDKAKTLIELDHAARNRLLLLCIMVNMRELTTLTLVAVAIFFGFMITGTIMPSRF